MPCKTLDSAPTARIFTLPSPPIFSVGAARTIKFTGNRLADAIGALEERLVKWLMRSVILRGTRSPIQAVRISILAIEESPGQQWLMPKTQLTRIRMDVPNCRPCRVGKG